MLDQFIQLEYFLHCWLARERRTCFTVVKTNDDGGGRKKKRQLKKKIARRKKGPSNAKKAASCCMYSNQAFAQNALSFNSKFLNEKL